LVKEARAVPGESERGIHAEKEKGVGVKKGRGTNARLMNGRRSGETKGWQGNSNGHDTNTKRGGCRITKKPPDDEELFQGGGGGWRKRAKGERGVGD